MRNIEINKIEGFENCEGYILYEDGTIISNKKGKEKVIKGYDNGKGYLTIDLHYKHKRGVKIHRLIATAFVPNPKNKQQVNHINGNKKDNRASNLEWVTNAENQLHANKLGLVNHKYNHDKEARHVLKYSKNGELIAEYNSIGKACIETFGEYNKTKTSNIYGCIIGKNKTAYGYKWSFKEGE